MGFLLFFFVLMSIFSELINQVSRQILVVDFLYAQVVFEDNFLKFEVFHDSQIIILSTSTFCRSYFQVFNSEILARSDFCFCFQMTSKEKK